MSKHTPGPWAIDSHMGRIESIGPVSAGGEAADDTDLETWLDVSTANARLIAAAPELLETLRSLVDAVNHYIPHHSGIGEMTAARAAIAKAEGAP